MPRKKKVKQVIEEKSELTQFRGATAAKDIPGYKTSFKKGGVTFSIGDTVLCTHADETHKGTLISVLSSQFMIESEDLKYGKFYFYNGTKIVKAS